MKSRCKGCGVSGYSDQGQGIQGRGVTIMAYGSRYDMNVYQFTLVEGWYCYKCLDKEVAEGLCQPIKEWKLSDSISPWEWFYPKGKDGRVDQTRQKKNFEYFLGPLDDFVGGP